MITVSAVSDYSKYFNIRAFDFESYMDKPMHSYIVKTETAIW